MENIIPVFTFNRQTLILKKSCTDQILIAGNIIKVFVAEILENI